MKFIFRRHIKYFLIGFAFPLVLLVAGWLVLVAGVVPATLLLALYMIGWAIVTPIPWKRGELSYIQTIMWGVVVPVLAWALVAACIYALTRE